MKKHILSLALTFVLCLCLLPSAVFAGTGDTPWQLLQKAMNGNSIDCAQFTSFTDDGFTMIELKDDVTSTDNAFGPLVVGTGTVVLRLNGHNIDRAVGNTAIVDGYVISVGADSTLKIYDDFKTGKITGGNNSSSAGGILVNGGYLGMVTCSVSGNTAGQFGGGIYVSSGTVELYSATVSGNAAGRFGGGIYIKDGVLSMSGGAVNGNTAQQGGGIYTCKSVSLGGVSFDANIASSNGGGLYTSDYAIAGNLSFKDCSAKKGGAVYVAAGGRFEAVGGKIENCKAVGDESCGGGVCVGANSVATFANGVSISGCEAEQYGGGIFSEGAVGLETSSTTNCKVTADNGNGGGIYIKDSQIFTGKDAKVNGNTKGSAENNLYLNSGAKVTIGSGSDVPAPTSNMSIGVSVEVPGVFTTNEGTNYVNYFSSDSDEYEVILSADQKLQMGKLFTVTVSEMDNGSVEVDKEEAFKGDKVTLTITPDDNYSLLSVSYNDGDSSHEITKTEDEYSFAMPDKDVTINAEFAGNEYTVEYKDMGGTAFSGKHDSNYPQSHIFGTETALKGASKEGYTFAGWFTSSDCSGKAVTRLGAKEYTSTVTLYAKWEQNAPVEYMIIEGKDGEWTKGSKTGLSFTSDASFAKFDSVLVDEKAVDAANYIAVEGSTKITLAPEYLETLSEGSHSIEVASTDGSAATTFTVKAENKEVDPNTPKTGDTSNTMLWNAVLLMSSISLVLSTVLGKKRKSE